MKGSNPLRISFRPPGPRCRRGLGAAFLCLLLCLLPCGVAAGSR